MGFFAEFNAWLGMILSTYITDNTARLAAALTPAILAFSTVYVMVWGYLQLTGKIEEPFVAGLKRLIVLAVLLGGSLHLWLYDALIVDTFFQAPTELAAVMIGAYDPVTIVDSIILDGNAIAERLLEKGGILDGNFSYYFAAFAVYLIVGLTTIYTVFLLALSRIALSILLALGPLFIALLFFETSKRFFEAWIAQLSNYAFITLLTVLAAALMMTLLKTAADQTMATGGGVTIAQAVRVCMAAGLTFLVMRQVMPMSQGLASGVALSSFGAVSAMIAWGFGSAARKASHHSDQFRRGLRDTYTHRDDGWSRRAGQRLQKRLTRRENSIRAS